MSIYKVIRVRHHKLQGIFGLQTYHTLHITYEHLINLVQIRARECNLVAYTIVAKLCSSNHWLITLHMEHRQQVGRGFLSSSAIEISESDVSIIFLYVGHSKHNLVDILADDRGLMLHIATISRKVYSRDNIHILTADEHFITHLYIGLHRSSSSHRRGIFHSKLVL